MQDAYTKEVSGQSFETKARGPYLQWAMEYQVQNPDGPKYYLLAMKLLADVSLDGNLSDSFTVVYDMESDRYYNNINFDFSSDVIGGLLLAEDMQSQVSSGGVVYSEYEFIRMLTAEEVGEVNASLGLVPLEENASGEVERVTEPVVMLEAEQLSQAALNALMGFFISGDYASIAAEDASLIQIRNAMEYGNPDFQGWHTHLLMLELADVNVDTDTPILILDITTGEVFHRPADVDMPTSFDTMEAVYSLCSMSYETFLQGDDDFIWDAENEICNVLDADIIDQINGELAVFCAEMADQKQETARENAASLNADQQQIYEAVLAFRDSQRYREVSRDPGWIQIEKIVEYTLEDLNGYPVHACLIRMDNVDTDIHGASAAVLVLDMDTGKAYTDRDVDMENWGDFDSIEDTFALLMNSDALWEDTDASIWSEGESVTYLPQNDLDAINDVLN